MPYSLGWFSTGRDEAAQEILKAVYREKSLGNPDLIFSFVFSNRSQGESEETDHFFDLVKEYKIPLVCFSSAKYLPDLRKESIREWRRKYDQEVLSLLADFRTNLNILAGYMLIVSDIMCKKYKMINLHPAKPRGPSGTWQQVIWKLIQERATETGVTMHLVNENLDEGPPITYCTFSIREGLDRFWAEFEYKLKDRTVEQIMKDEGEQNALFLQIRRQGVIREIPLIIHTIKQFVEEKISIQNTHVLTADGQIHQDGICLNKIIETQVLNLNP